MKRVGCMHERMGVKTRCGAKLNPSAKCKCVASVISFSGDSTRVVR